MLVMELTAISVEHMASTSAWTAASIPLYVLIAAQTGKLAGLSILGVMFDDPTMQLRLE